MPTSKPIPKPNPPPIKINLAPYEPGPSWIVLPASIDMQSIDEEEFRERFACEELKSHIQSELAS
jgi:hypothetical protein